MIIDAPVSIPAYGRPQAFAWNSGTMASTRSLCRRSKLLGRADVIVCRKFERWL